MRLLKNPKFLSFLFVFLVSVGFMVTAFFYPEVHFGQLGKQTFAAQMIESTSRGELLHGVFPLRHFIEAYHQDLIYWAEEVPVYSFLSAGLMHLFGLSAVMAGKTLAFISFLLIILGFAKIAEKVNAPMFIFASVAAAYPVFRLYSVQVMPDLCMTACLVWAIYYVLQDRFARVAILILLASLFKYYAVFTGGGIVLYYLFQKRLRESIILSLMMLPCVLYVVWFVYLGIPNPVTESRIADGHGHLSSLQNVFLVQNWARVMLWWFVKNSSIPGTLFALFGASFMFKANSKLRPFALCLGLGFLIFPVLFVSSFYVHDYYGLQGSIGIALLAAIGVSELYKRLPKAAVIGFLVFLGFSLVTVDFMARIMPDYAILENEVRNAHLDEGGYLLSISGISKPVISYHLHRDAYVIGVDEWARDVTQKRLSDPRIKYAMVHDFKGQIAVVDGIESALKTAGFSETLLSLHLSQTEFRLLSR